MPDLVPPMQPSAGSGQPPTGADWVVELAWTGHRCIAYVEPGRRTRLLSARNVSMTAAYPELAPPLEVRSPPRGMVLDGTLVARGEEHAPRARLLKRRSARYHPSAEHIRAVPVDFQVADLLWLDGHSTVDLPYRDRRSLLEGLGFDAAPIWSTSPLPVSELDTMLRIADAKGVDALHARHLGSRYRPGGRSPLWVKVPVPRVREVVVGGWTPTDVGRPDAIASLLLGVPDGDGLRYVGRVGVAGDQRRQVARLGTLRRARSPFGTAVPAAAARHAIWVTPRLVGLVEFTGWVHDGRLRLPRWRGLVDPRTRPVDVDPARWARPPAPPPDRTARSPAPGQAAAPTAPAAETGTGDAAATAATHPATTHPATAHPSSAGPSSAGPSSAHPRTADTATADTATGHTATASTATAGTATAGSATTGTATAGSATTGTATAGSATAGSATTGSATTTTGTAARAAAPAPDPSPAPPAPPPGASRPAPNPVPAPDPEPAPVQARRLEQHFVYNTLNTIAALIRTDPGRARELLFGFADLSRAADQPGDAPTTLAQELDAVRAYLQLEQARFGKRLRVQLDLDPGLARLPVPPRLVLDTVRAAVQQGVEPRPEGGSLLVRSGVAADGPTVTVAVDGAQPVVITLPRDEAAVPG